MATHKSSTISNVRNPLIDRQKALGDVYTYDGVYEAIVISSKDVQKNGRIKIRLIDNNTNVNYVEENDPQDYLNITVQWSSPFAGATNLKDTVATAVSYTHPTLPTILLV